jgi:hypothetical protein
MLVFFDFIFKYFVCLLEINTIVVITKDFRTTLSLTCLNTSKTFLHLNQ